MPTLSRFMGGFLTAGDVELGRLVLDTAKPQKNFCKATSLKLTDSDRSRRVFKNVESLTNATSASSFKLLLTKILEVFASKSAKSVDTIKTTQAISYELRNVNEKFDVLLQEEKVTRWMEKYRSKANIYMVVALHTVQNVSVALDASESSEVKAKVTIPAASVLDAAAPGASALAAPIINPEISGSHMDVNTTCGAGGWAEREFIRTVDCGSYGVENPYIGDFENFEPLFGYTWIDPDMTVAGNDRMQCVQKFRLRDSWPVRRSYQAECLIGLREWPSPISEAEVATSHQKTLMCLANTKGDGVRILDEIEVMGREDGDEIVSTHKPVVKMALDAFIGNHHTCLFNIP
ncbi:hypothetical protein CONLIGDRAFT_690614 [Coniochaeta ligniaria NRRL 30616]|uniref:Uncharacterized protein n=1 Tax=Coniochaeta ligniaria NRRL 30616 TaxID=1408157 RepID=A0A1J7JBJ7_9PEZI|nr:hypothetical protein CONLIGDRAFT_690614 [Coniochaeta ligniaria NRRL 30616]